MTRKLPINSFSIVAIAAALFAVACSSSDPPDDSSTSTGGSTSTGSTATGGSGQTSSATTTSGGATATSGGATNQGGAGGGSNTDAGGSTAAGGTTGADHTFLPACGLTLAGKEAKKGETCTPEDVQLCYRTCGPKSSGFKPETCTAGSYSEPSNTCYYPASRDYSCYKVPTTLPDAATCGLTTTPPKSGQPCGDVPDCTLCSLNGGYLDSSDAAKAGYCVCYAKEDGSKVWSCAGSNIWPCPGNPGC